MKRQISAILLIAVVLATLFGIRHLWQVATVGAAYKSKILCSAVFVSGRAPESVFNADLSVDDLAGLRLIGADVDRQARRVTAGPAGLDMHAVQYRPGLGCTSVIEGYVSPLPASGIPHPSNPSDWPDHLRDGRRDGRIDRQALQAVVDRAFTEPDPERPRRTRAVVIVHDGTIAGERYAPGFGRDTALLGWSMAKSVTHALTGIAVKQGRLSVADRVDSPVWNAPDDPRRAITVEHLLHMSAALEFDEEHGKALSDATRMLFLEADMAAYAADRPLVGAPGKVWDYSTGTTNILSAVLRRALPGDAYLSFPRRELFEPLGMHSAVLEPDASGTFVGSAFMYATARDWAKFGQLYLQDGVWNGRRILPEGWVEYATTPAPADSKERYGAHFWLKLPEPYRRKPDTIRLPDDAFHAIGLEGQLISIIPSAKLVVVRLGLSRLHGVWPHDVMLDGILTAIGDTNGAGKTTSTDE